MVHCGQLFNALLPGGAALRVPTVPRIRCARAGAGLGVIYALTYPATDVYGCSQPLPAYTPSLMASVGLAVAGLLWLAQNVSAVLKFVRT